MKAKSKPIVILTILFGYVLLQFIWWEILLVRQTGTIITERQKLLEISIANEAQLKREVQELHDRKTRQTLMIVGEGTVFLLLLLFGIYKIRQAQDREVALTSQQNNFFLSVTHELKTPIAATKLQLQTLQKQKLAPEVQARLLNSAIQENDRLNTLIDKVLLASRLGSGVMQLAKKRTDAAALSSSILQRYFDAALKNNKLHTVFPPEPVYCDLDEQAFTSILTNLVENAFKYSGSNAPVKVYLKKEKAWVMLQVCDTGPGISNAEKKKIFERFYRTGNEETRSSRGTGLGLYIVNTLVKQLGGNIVVKDNSPSGTIFEVRFNGA